MIFVPFMLFHFLLKKIKIQPNFQEHKSFRTHLSQRFALLKGAKVINAQYLLIAYMKTSFGFSSLVHSDLFQCKSIDHSLVGKQKQQISVQGRGVKRTRIKTCIKQIQEQRKRKSSEIRLVFGDKQLRAQKASRKGPLTKQLKVESNFFGEMQAKDNEKTQNTNNFTLSRYNEEDLIEAVLSMYAEQVFPSRNKFQRFSNLLRQRYLVGSQSEQMDQTSRSSLQHSWVSQNDSIRQIHESKMKKMLETRERKRKSMNDIILEKEYFSPKVHFKKRPSSGIPMKNPPVKAREASKTVTESKPKHRITSLVDKDVPYSQENSIVRSMRVKIQNRVQTEPTLKEKLKSIGEQNGIYPWENQNNAGKTINDLDIEVKLSP